MLLALIFRSQSAVSKKWMMLYPLLKRCCELFNIWKLEGYSSTRTLEKPEMKWRSPCLWESIQSHIQEEWKKYFKRYLVNEHQVSCVLGETGSLWKNHDQIVNKRHIAWKGTKLRLQLSMNSSTSLFLGTWLCTLILPFLNHFMPFSYPLIYQRLWMLLTQRWSCAHRKWVSSDFNAEYRVLAK